MPAQERAKIAAVSGVNAAALPARSRDADDTAAAMPSALPIVTRSEHVLLSCCFATTCRATALSGALGLTVADWTGFDASMAAQVGRLDRLWCGSSNLQSWNGCRCVCGGGAHKYNGKHAAGRGAWPIDWAVHVLLTGQEGPGSGQACGNGQQSQPATLHSYKLALLLTSLLGGLQASTNCLVINARSSRPALAEVQRYRRCWQAIL